MKDRELIELIHKGGADEDEAFTYIYNKLRKPIVDYIRAKNSISSDEAIDIFQDALVSFRKTVKTNKFREASTIKTFITRVCLYLAIKKKEKNQREENLDYIKTELVDMGFLPDYRILKDEQLGFFSSILARLKVPCKDILISAYTLKYDSNEKNIYETIAQKFGLKSKEAAKTRKYRCEEELKKLISENQGVKNLLKNLIENE